MGKAFIKPPRIPYCIYSLFVQLHHLLLKNTSSFSRGVIGISDDAPHIMPAPRQKNLSHDPPGFSSTGVFHVAHFDERSVVPILGVCRHAQYDLLCRRKARRATPSGKLPQNFTGMWVFAVSSCPVNLRQCAQIFGVLDVDSIAHRHRVWYANADRRQQEKCNNNRLNAPCGWLVLVIGDAALFRKSRICRQDRITQW